MASWNLTWVNPLDNIQINWQILFHGIECHWKFPGPNLTSPFKLDQIWMNCISGLEALLLEKKRGERKLKSFQQDGKHPGPIPFFVNLVNATPKKPQTQSLNSNWWILWLWQVTIERPVESLWNQCHTLYKPGTLLLMFLCLTVEQWENQILSLVFHFV